jgi:hypothetical protein
MTFETTTYHSINNTHILTIFGDVMTYNQLKDLPLDLTTELKVSFNRIDTTTTNVKVWFDDEIVMDWKPMKGHHDLFYHLQALDEENEDTEDLTEYETEEEEEEEEEWSLKENQRCWGNLIDEEFPDITAEQKKCLLSIAKEVDFIDIKPFSHNIVGLELRILDEKGFDNDKINKVIKLFGLEEKGWGYLLDRDL